MIKAPKLRWGAEPLQKDQVSKNISADAETDHCANVFIDGAKYDQKLKIVIIAWEYLSCITLVGTFECNI